MLAGLVNTGPTLKTPVQDSKDRNSEAKGQNFGDILGTKAEPRSSEKSDISKSEPKVIKSTPDRTNDLSFRDRSRTDNQESSDSKTESPPDPKVMDPRTSVLKAKREQAIRKFMDSFESEFGIPPQEMVGAMSQLTTQDLEKPPDKTADSIISKLGLSPQDELKAKKMYMGLLMQLKQIDSFSTLPKVQDDLLSQMSAQRVLLSAQKKDVMTGQVQNLNDRFWMKNGMSEKALPTAQDQIQAHEFLKKMVTAEASQLEGLPEDDPKVVATTEKVMKQLEMEMPQVKQEGVEGKDSQPSEVHQAQSFIPEVASGKVLSHQQKMSQQQSGQQNMNQNSNSMQTENLKSHVSVSREALAAEFKSLGLKVPEEHSPSHKIEKADVEALLNPSGQVLPQAKIDTLKAMLATMGPQHPVEMTPTQKTENIQQIMNQAQILLKNGGGEVKVEMTPEGMGSIQMKLQVADGKVQLHMNTETKEAKKLIETSMNDLKQSLAAHQLSVDLVKVDVVNQTGSSHHAHNDLQQQMQNFLNHQQREGTRQFWNQFNENFGNRQARENYYDARNIQAPAKDQLLPGFNSTSNNGRASRDGRGNSLNLVA